VRVWHYNNYAHPALSEGWHFNNAAHPVIGEGWDYNNAPQPVIGEGLGIIATLLIQLLVKAWNFTQHCSPSYMWEFCILLNAGHPVLGEGLTLLQLCSPSYR